MEQRQLSFLVMAGSYEVIFTSLCSFTKFSTFFFNERNYNAHNFDLQADNLRHTAD